MDQHTTPRDFATGCTQGKPWDWYDSMVAELAVVAHRQELTQDRAAKIVDAELGLALCMASRMGLLLFVIRFAQFVWFLTWHAASLDEQEDEFRSILFRNGPAS